MALVDSMLCAFSVWSIGFALLIIRKPRWDLAMVLGYLMGAALLTKTPGFFAMVTMPLTVLTFSFKQAHRQSRIVKLFLLWIVAIVITVGIYNVLRLGPGFSNLNSRNQDYVLSPMVLLERPWDPFVPHLGDLTDFWPKLLGWLVLIFLGVGNTGVLSAEEIVSSIDGVACAIPDFSRLDTKTEPTDFNDLKNLAGRAEVRSQLEAVEINRPHLLFALGHNNGSYYFTTTRNPQIQSIREFSQTEFIRLRSIKYWIMKYGDAKGTVDWAMAKEDLIRVSESKGIFDPERVRGVGIYFEGETLVFHLGDRLYFESGETKYLSDIESENIYEPKVKLPLPERLSGIPDMARAAKAIEMFSWSHPFEAKLVMGWNLVAPLAGILDWRPHVSIQAPKGKGKSSILRYVAQPCQKYLNGRSLSGMTEAGLRQVIKTDTTAVMLDEVDSNSLDEKSFQRIVSLLRLCSSGGEITRGTPSGKALRFKANFSALMVGINMPAMVEADRSRFAELELMAEHREKDW
jgi:hypothetical protein